MAGSLERYFRKIIKITAEMSPNVRYARAQIAAGIEPTNEVIIPGVMPWADYQRRRMTWDVVRQTIGLDAEFYKGAELLLYPCEWLNYAEFLHESVRLKDRVALAIGIDPAEGGDKTSMCAIDEYGVVEIVSRKTPNTAHITKEAKSFGLKHHVPPQFWMFDRGGGGTQHADILRQEGYPVRTVSFGGVITQVAQRRQATVKEQTELQEDKYVYKNLRAEMYGELRKLLDPSMPGSFALPKEYTELRSQMAPIPLLYDHEGRFYLPPKRKRSKGSTEKSLEEIIGHSPDELDSLVLAVYARDHAPKTVMIGAF